MTGAERTWASRYQTEDVVRYSRGSKLVSVEPGTYATVVAVNAAENLLTIRKTTGDQISYDPKRLSGVNVYREVERAFSKGDRIQFTAPDKQLSVANRELGTIQAIDTSGNISLRLEDGRMVQFNGAEHRHFDHGYALTSHSSQGLTADRVLVHVDTSIHPQLINSRFAYVAISRARIDAEIYTNDATNLGQKMSSNVSKSSAIEFSHSKLNTTKDCSLDQNICG